MKRYRTLYKRLINIIRGFDLWDHFKYDEAYKLLNPDEIESFHDIAVTLNETSFVFFADSCRKPVKKLEKICTRGAGASENIKSCHIIFDILSNASRRAEQGQFDDAIMRLYRALEMAGQVELAKFDVDDSNVSIENPRLNESARGWLESTFSGSSDIKLALENKFNLLNLLGNPKGKNYFDNISEFRKVLTQRNESFLAHGFRRLESKDYERFRNLLYGFISDRTQDSLTVFPKMEV